jgi:4-hydroxy-tetrahydrodipicolinate reductase
MSTLRLKRFGAPVMAEIPEIGESGRAPGASRSQEREFVKIFVPSLVRYAKDDWIFVGKSHGIAIAEAIKWGGGLEYWSDGVMHLKSNTPTSPTKHMGLFQQSAGECIRVLVLGMGQMGSGIARLVLDKQGLELVGSCGHRAEHLSMDVGRAIGLDRDLGIRITADLDSTIQTTQPHVAIQTTCSRVADAAAEISPLVRHGIHVISIAEEMAFPACASPALADELNRLAIANKVSILGTGINPGFVLDLLAIALTGVCANVESIIAARVNDLSPYGPTVLRSQGVGLWPEEFHRGLKDGSVVGHIGFPQSIHMIAGTLGWEIARISESRDPIIARVPRETPFVKVAPGQVAGCLHTAIAYCKEKPVITLTHPQQIHPQLEGVETGDTIEICGIPNVHLAGSPEIPGGTATIALAVNMIPRVLNARPGLHTMAELPVPAAMLGDARRLIRDRLAEERHG